MIIYVKAGGLLTQYLQPDWDRYTRRLEVEEGLTVSQLLERMNIRPALVAFVLVGGKVVSLDYRPADSEVITLQPPVQGG